MTDRGGAGQATYRAAGIVLLLLGLAGPVPVYGADTTKLVVTVVAAEDRSAIADARVLVTGANDLDRTANTDSNGKAVFKHLPHAEITVQVVATGFENHGEHVTLSEKERALAVTMKKSEALPAEAVAIPKPD